MENLQVQVEVSKEAYELFHALAKVAIAAKIALKDGVQASDISAMVSEIMSKEVVDGLAGIEGIKAELAESKAMVAAGFLAAAMELVEELAK